MLPYVAFALLASQETVEYRIDGVVRSAIVVAPSRPTAHPPLVFAFHGHMGNPRQAQRSYRIEKLWPQAVVVYPAGLPTKGMTDPTGRYPGWQQKPGDEGDRDVKFFDAMYKDLVPKMNVDRTHVYSLGHSNGGRFTSVLWAVRGDFLAAVGISSSPTVAGTASQKPVFFVAGEKDSIVPYRWMTISIQQAVKRNGLSEQGTSISDLLTLYPGANPVETYIHPGGHAFPQDAVKAMVTFLSQQTAKR